ncbi:hypothetical protein, partial [Salmonella enterica]|uniref:hypothetical protein n=1 Tax=Salmonella enterica TaxID=28901 RepID=UPI001BAF0309
DRVILELVQLDDSTVLIILSRRTILFSTTSPPLPSLLMLVTNGPAWLEQPARITDDRKTNESITFFI